MRTSQKQVGGKRVGAKRVGVKRRGQKTRSCAGAVGSSRIAKDRNKLINIKTSYGEKETLLFIGITEIYLEAR